MDYTSLCNEPNEKTPMMYELSTIQSVATTLKTKIIQLSVFLEITLPLPGSPCHRRCTGNGRFTYKLTVYQAPQQSVIRMFKGVITTWYSSGQSTVCWYVVICVILQGACTDLFESCKMLGKDSTSIYGNKQSNIFPLFV